MTFVIVRFSYLFCKLFDSFLFHYYRMDAPYIFDVENKFYRVVCCSYWEAVVGVFL